MPERLEMVAKAREKLGLPPVQEPTRPTTAITVNPVATIPLRQGYVEQALEDPATREKVIMIKEVFPAMQITQVEEFEPGSTTYNEVEYEEVLT